MTKLKWDEEWDEDAHDVHTLRLSTGCMSFEVDLDLGIISMQTDIRIVDTSDAEQFARIRRFCSDIVHLYNEPERNL
jgi:hypothetical protein